MVSRSGIFSDLGPVSLAISRCMIKNFKGGGRDAGWEGGSSERCLSGVVGGHQGIFPKHLKKEGG